MRQIKQRTNRLRYILYIAPILTLSFITHNTSALEYSSPTNIQFTFNPTISISISGNLSIDNLSPGTAKDSNIVDVSVATNNVSGYSLSATVGTNATNDRLTNISNSSYYFTNLTSNIASLTSFNDNTWGYSYSVDNGTNWVSGSISNTLAGYNGLPLDTNTNANERGKGGITLVDTYNTADSKTIKFKIGAKAANTQAAGTYNNTINFYAIAHDSPKTFQEAYIAEGKELYNGYYTMQDMTHSICEAVDIDANIQLIDIRDDEIYTIAKLKDNNCWMLDNLRLGGDEPIILTKQDTNIIAENWILPINTINTDSNTYTEPLINTDYKENTVTRYGIGSGKIGVYYNYCASSAGTYCYAEEEGVDKQNTLIDIDGDICSLAWRLPTGGSNGEYQTILNFYNLSQSASDDGSLQYNLSLSRSGRFTFRNGEHIMGIYGYWWTSTYAEKSYMNSLLATSSIIEYPMANFRSNGFSLRCLAK